MKEKTLKDDIKVPSNGLGKKTRIALDLVCGAMTLAIAAVGVATYLHVNTTTHPSERDLVNPLINFHYPTGNYSSRNGRISDENGDNLADAIVDDRGDAVFYTNDWTGPRRDDAIRMSPEMRDDATVVMTKGRNLGREITQRLYDEHTKDGRRWHEIFSNTSGKTEK